MEILVRVVIGPDGVARVPSADRDAIQRALATVQGRSWVRQLSTQEVVEALEDAAVSERREGFVRLWGGALPKAYRYRGDGTQAFMAWVRRGRVAAATARLERVWAPETRYGERPRTHGVPQTGPVARATARAEVRAALARRRQERRANKAAALG